jgi:hypothetical protein
MVVAIAAMLPYSCGPSARDFWTWSIEKRMQALSEARKDIDSSTQPSALVNSQIRQGDLHLTFVRDAAQAGNLTLVRERIREYQTAMRTAYRILSERGDPEKHWKQYKKLEIALRLHQKHLLDIEPILRVTDRGPIDTTIEEISSIRDRVLLALFGYAFRSQTQTGTSQP